MRGGEPFATFCAGLIDLRMRHTIRQSWDGRGRIEWFLDRLQRTDLGHRDLDSNSLQCIRMEH